MLQNDKANNWLLPFASTFKKTLKWEGNTNFFADISQEVQIVARIQKHEQGSEERQGPEPQQPCLFIKLKPLADVEVDSITFHIGKVGHC